MTELNDKMNQLQNRLESLEKRHEHFLSEIKSLRHEINALKTIPEEEPAMNDERKQNIPPAETEVKVMAEDTIHVPIQPYQSPVNRQTNLEKFIGENLINKIGIAITVIGVAIGAKYSIEHGMISPLARIILGYLFGLVLLGFGIKLKNRYENYSAVLVSGAMAILYFITFSAAGIYHLIPVGLAFGLMILFTLFTVIAAIHYNRQVIAHIGLVGAYAIPFMLSEGSENVRFLFSYMAIINIGILAISVTRYWKPLYYASFGITWLIYLIWYIFDYEQIFFLTGLAFLTVYFSIFYLTALIYKLLKKEKFDSGDIVLLIVNSFIYYGIGYSILSNHHSTVELLGLFTLFNAIIHFIVSVIIYKQKLADRNLFYLVIGLVLIFLTITFPVQLDGNWVTLLWVGEAALLFRIGRTKNVSFYEKISYLLMILALFSIIHDWISGYGGYIPEDPETRITPILNINFISSLLFVSAFGYINMLNKKIKSPYSLSSTHLFPKAMIFLIPAIFFITFYFAFLLEISNYWNERYADSMFKVLKNGNTNNFGNFDLKNFGTVWMINYSMLYISILTFINIRKFKNNLLGSIHFVLTFIMMAVFLTFGLYTLSELRDHYLEQRFAEYYESGMFNIIIRYVSFGFVALLLVLCNRYSNSHSGKKEKNQIAFQLLLHISILWIASSEFIHWMDIADSTQSYKLGLSILWGIYSLFMISLGIWKKNKYLRMAAIVLFGITLIKLFFFDLSHLNTIAKTIVFVSLGILLLIISFLYHKFKHIISDEVIR